MQIVVGISASPSHRVITDKLFAWCCTMENANQDNASSREGLLLRMGLNDNKAGMQGLDKEKINKIIMEASKGSRFYENELKKDQQVNKRIEKMLKLKSKITDQQILKAQLQMDKLAIELDQNRDLSCTIVHIDMDAFYAAVEMRDNPVLRDKPIAVGSLSMLSTSNYHARRYGVRAAMPGFIAKKLCPHLIIVPLNFKKYEEVSKQIREILAEYDPQFMPMGLDEAYLNITEYLEEQNHCCKRKHLSTSKFGLNGKQNIIISDESNLSEDMHSCSPVLFDSDTLIDKQTIQPSLPIKEQQCQQSRVQLKADVSETSAEEVVNEIRLRIEQKTGMTASAGIAPNMMLAKMCSDKNKPNGQYRIPPERDAVMDFIKNLAIRKVPGIGKVTEKMLKALEIETCTELYQQRALISLLFSETSCQNFLEISLGLGSTHLERDWERKSMSTERTFNEISASEQYKLCQELCSDLAQDLKKEGLKARTITLKLKNVNFEVKTRANTVLSAVSTEDEIFAIAKDLLKSEMEIVAPEPLRLRLMGVRVSGFLTEEEKKYHQKSIVNFLGPGKQACAFKKAVIFPKVSEGESFFNKKRATREQTNQEIFLNESSNKKSLPDTMSTITSGEQRKDDEHQIFICPICFEEQQDSTLETFNRHIDMCLRGTKEKENAEITDNSKSWRNDLPVDMGEKEEIKAKISKPPVNDQSINIPDCDSASGKDVLPKCLVHKQNENGCGPSNASVSEMHAKDDLSSGALIDKEESNYSGSNLQSFSGITENVFVCPVCNTEQKTKDLTLFNRHVDVCLNKGIIEQLTEKSGHEILDRGQYNTNFSAGTKRSGTIIPQSTSKKVKSGSNRCTIESFFK